MRRVKTRHHRHDQREADDHHNIRQVDFGRNAVKKINVARKYFQPCGFFKKIGHGIQIIRKHKPHHSSEHDPQRSDAEPFHHKDPANAHARCSKRPEDPDVLGLFHHDHGQS